MGGYHSICLNKLGLQPYKSILLASLLSMGEGILSLQVHHPLGLGLEKIFLFREGPRSFLELPLNPLVQLGIKILLLPQSLILDSKLFQLLLLAVEGFLKVVPCFLSKCYFKTTRTSLLPRPRQIRFKLSILVAKLEYPLLPPPAAKLHPDEGLI